MDTLLIEDLKEEYDDLSADGFRVLAMAYKDVEHQGRLFQGRRKRSGPEGLRGFSRSAEGHRRAGHCRPCKTTA